MAGSGIDEDIAIALVAGGGAALCLIAALSGFRRGRMGACVAWLVAAGTLGFVAYFFATFSIRLF